MQQNLDTAPQIFKSVRDTIDYLAGLQVELAEALDRCWNLPGRTGIDGIETVASRLSEKLQSAPDSLLFALQLSPQQILHPQYPIYMAAIALLLARRRGLHNDKQFAIVAAALSCDIAMHERQSDIARQIGPLTPVQWTKIKRHPIDATERLGLAGLRDPVWLDAILSHHERLDGSGYPNGLNNENIRVPARVLAIADVYTASVREKSYRPQSTSREILREIFLARGQMLDAQLAEILIREIGVFPPGTLVRTTRGDLAIVLERGINAVTPRLLMLDESAERLVDPVAIVEPEGSAYRGLRPLPNAENPWVSRLFYN